MAIRKETLIKCRSSDCHRFSSCQGGKPNASQGYTEDFPTQRGRERCVNLTDGAEVTSASLVLFDNDYELLHDCIDIRAVAPLTEEAYRVGGSTALLDAIGRTIKKIRDVQKQTAEDYRASNRIESCRYRWLTMEKEREG